MEQVAEVYHNITALETSFTNLHTRLRMFVQCTIQNLLGADSMHQLPLDWDVSHWQEWNASITAAIDGIIHTLLASLVGHESIPKYALLTS